MKFLSDANEYALRAVVWLSRHPGRMYNVKEIAKGTSATPGYLAKVLQTLAKAGLLEAKRGTGGGFVLRRKPHQMTVLDVVEAIDPIARIHTCPLDIESHGTRLCPLHKKIDRAVEMIEQSFASVTIAQLLENREVDESVCLGLTSSDTTI